MITRLTSSLRAALTVAAVYGFFLIFAQFSFVELLRAGGVGPSERFLLGLMAAGGIAGGFFTAWKGPSPGWVRGALVLAGLAAVLATTSPGIAGFSIAAFVTGGALGVATVGLAALLPAWCGLGWVGLGTGLAYATCNLPLIFQMPPVDQAWMGMIFAISGALVIPPSVDWKMKPSDHSEPFPLWVVLVVFTALVWTDSAAFFIIQHSIDLKSGTWGESMLWRNAVVHFLLACGAGAWLSRGGASHVLPVAWVLLSVAALLVNHAASRPISAWIYPAAVSLYSTALVAWPAWFSGVNSPKDAAWRAAWLFSIAGWFGSANGIGMVRSLLRVPVEFVVLSGVMVVSALLLSDIRRWRIWLVLTAMGLVTWMVGVSEPSPLANDVERGRQVYVSEGCLHCHSQYVRPGSGDEALWGGASDMEKVLEGQPVLIGNRRQGPDLVNIGARRSPAWLKAHLIEPRNLVPKSPMPSYAHLFSDRRGNDLVRYQAESGRDRIEDVKASADRWVPAGDSAGLGGKALFTRYCTACHGVKGLGDGPLAERLSKKPANLKMGPFLWTPPGEDLHLRVSRVVKFGVPGTDMPGHEVMTDAQIKALATEVLMLRNH